MFTSAADLARLIPCQMPDPLLTAEGLLHILSVPRPWRPEAEVAVSEVFAGLLGTTPSHALTEAQCWATGVRALLASAPQPRDCECGHSMWLSLPQEPLV